MHRFLAALLSAVLLAFGADSSAQSGGSSVARGDIIAAWCQGDREARIASFEAVLERIAATAREKQQPILARALLAYRDGDLLCGDQGVFFPAGERYQDVISERVVDDPPADASAPFLNIPLRRALDPFASAVALLTGQNTEVRVRAARNLAGSLGDVPVEIIQRVYKNEANSAVKTALSDVLVPALLASGEPTAQLQAISTLSERSTRTNRATLDRFLENSENAIDEAVLAAAQEARDSIHTVVQLSEAATVAYHGLSYGSVLFLAALGLAIVFGLMGVINLAQAEFVMLGAYTTWFVQELLAMIAPGLAHHYLWIALPFAFLAPAMVGIFMEWGIVRHLYHRPLLTLLATWAVSLLLINLVRVTVGTQNLSFITPDYLKLGVNVFGEFSVTWSRLLSIVIAGLTLAGTLLILYRTRFGLRMRATTQHREMAGCVGVSTRRTDAMAFAFGSGLAGIAGLALTSIYNVNPTMGTSLIIDSFIVVVVGGVGSVLGTAIAALGIGQLNAIIEPQFGAVASKVIVLLAVIVFIQQKPNGLFPRKGRR
jgi:urea transport system permease protein